MGDFRCSSLSLVSVIHFKSCAINVIRVTAFGFVLHGQSDALCTAHGGSFFSLVLSEISFDSQKWTNV